MTIHFDAELRQIRSMADHTFNVIINIPEYNIEQVQQMMTMLGDMVAVAMIEVSENQEEEKYKKYQ
jgi:hypothetical protein